MVLTKNWLRSNVKICSSKMRSYRRWYSRYNLNKFQVWSRFLKRNVVSIKIWRWGCCKVQWRNQGIGWRSHISISWKIWLPVWRQIGKVNWSVTFRKYNDWNSRMSSWGRRLWRIWRLRSGSRKRRPSCRRICSRRSVIELSLCSSCRYSRRISTRWRRRMRLCVKDWRVCDTNNPRKTVVVGWTRVTRRSTNRCRLKVDTRIENLLV